MELGELKEKSNRIYFEVMIYWILIILAIILNKIFFYQNYYLIKYITFPFLFILIGWCQFSLSNAFHEALHGNFGLNQNNLLACLITAYPIGFTFGYKKVHLNHHKYFGNPNKDPDFSGYYPFPKSKNILLLRFLRDLSGISAAKQFFSNNAIFDNKLRMFKEYFLLIIVQILIFYLFLEIYSNIEQGGLFFIILWLFPLMTIGKFCSNTRLLCEHGSKTGLLTFRTITGSFYETYTLGAFNFNLHAEHHIKPWIPYTRLKSSINIINGKVDSDLIKYEIYDKGYLNMILKWFKDLPWE